MEEQIKQLEALVEYLRKSDRLKSELIGKLSIKVGKASHLSDVAFDVACTLREAKIMLPQAVSLMRCVNSYSQESGRLDEGDVT